MVIQDPLPLVRLGFEQLLQESGHPLELSFTADHDDLVHLCEELLPDVVVFELHPAADDVIAACRDIVPTARFIALHLGRRVDHLEHAQRLNAWLLSYAAPPEIALAVITGRASGTARVLDVERRRSNRTLLPLEREVLRLAGEGLTCAETALRLGVSPEIVQHLADDALRTLGAPSISSAVRRARETGLVPRARRAS